MTSTRQLETIPESSGVQYFGGIPTKPDVDKLIAKYGTPKPGVIPYSEIEQTLGIHKKEKRFRTITDKWRDRLYNECNVVVRTKKNTGFWVLAEPERVDDVADRHRTGCKMIVKNNELTSRINASKLDERSKAKHENIAFISAKMTKVVVSCAKHITTGMKTFDALPPAIWATDESDPVSVT